MAGLFGKSKKFNPLAAVREEPGLAERLANQVGMNLLGVDFIGMGRRKALGEAQRGFMNDLTGKLGPQYEEGPAPTVGEGGNAEAWEYTPPTRTSDGLNINSPELPALSLTAERLGVPLKGLIDVLKAQQPNIDIGPGGEPYNRNDAATLQKRFRNPSNVNGNVVDLNNAANEGAYFGEAPVKGAMPVYDNRGRVVDWRLPEGARGVIGAASGAEARGRTGGTMFSIPVGRGRTQMMTGDQYLGGAQGEGAGLTQSPADAAYDTDTAKAVAGQYNAIQTAGQRASGAISNFNRINQLLDGFSTGRFTPAGKELAKAAASLGIQVDPRWGNVEAADALSKKLALDAMGGSLGAGFSNADRAFVEGMNPSIVNTPAGRKQIIAFGVARAQRDQQVAQMARQWQQRAGRLDKPDRNGKTFFDYLDAFATAHPLVTK